MFTISVIIIFLVCLFFQYVLIYYIIAEDEKSKCITFYKRPSMSLLSAYRQTWKARHNHFARYSDVKPKGIASCFYNSLVKHLYYIFCN